MHGRPIRVNGSGDRETGLLVDFLQAEHMNLGVEQVLLGKNFFIPRRKVLFSLLLLLCYSRVIGAFPGLKLPVVRFLGFLALDLRILSFVF